MRFAGRRTACGWKAALKPAANAPRLAFSSATSSERQVLEAIGASLGAIVLAEDAADEATHLVLGRCISKRTTHALPGAGGADISRGADTSQAADTSETIDAAGAADAASAANAAGAADAARAADAAGVSDATERGAPKRTLKVLHAILRGAWIVHDEWLYRSLEAGALCAEAPFETCAFAGARRGRELSETREPIAPLKGLTGECHASPRPTKEAHTACPSQHALIRDTLILACDRPLRAPTSSSRLEPHAYLMHGAVAVAIIDRDPHSFQRLQTLARAAGAKITASTRAQVCIQAAAIKSAETNARRRGCAVFVGIEWLYDSVSACEKQPIEHYVQNRNA